MKRLILFIFTLCTITFLSGCTNDSSSIEKSSESESSLIESSSLVTESSVLETSSEEGSTVSVELPWIV